MRVDNQLARFRLPWASLLWLLPVLLLLGLAQLGASPVKEVRGADSSVVSVSQATAPTVFETDHASVDWTLYPVEPAQPEQSVAAYDRD